MFVTQGASVVSGTSKVTMCNVATPTRQTTARLCGWTQVGSDGKPIASAWFSVDGGPEIFVVPNSSGFVDTSTTLTEGTHSLRLYARSTAGNVTFEEKMVTVDRSPPVLRILAPTSDDVMTSPRVNVTTSVSDATAVNVQTAYGPRTLVESGVGTVTHSVDLVNTGYTTLLVTGRDAAGNSSEARVTVFFCPRTDPTCAASAHWDPVINGTYQSANTVPTTGGVTFRVTASDPQGSTLSYSWTPTIGTLGAPTNGATTSEVVWTPPACVPAGTRPSITATVSNAVGGSVSTTFSFATDGGGTAPEILTASLPDGYAGTAYDASLSASGGCSPYVWTLAAGALPEGLSLSSAGVLSGTPTASGTASFTVQVAEGNGVTSTRALTLAVFAPPAVTTASLPDGYAGTPYGATLSASGGKAPYAWTLSAGALPPGLSLASDGALSGTPTASGTASFTAQVADANGVTVSRALTLAVFGPPAVTTTSLPDGYAGMAYSATLSASGGKAPYFWTLAAGALPSGLFLSSDGALSGTPIASGTVSFTAQVADANGVSAIRALTLAVFAPPAVITSSLPDGYADTAYSASLSASGGKAPYSWTLAAGALPPGLSLSSAGALSGSPTVSGTASFTAQVTDANGVAASRALTLAVFTPPAVTTSSLPDGYTGTAYGATLSASGGKAPYAWTLSTGALPSGLTLSDSGALSGTPTASGTASFTAQVQDANGVTAAHALTLAVFAPPAVTTASLPDGYMGTAYSASLSASGGKVPYSWTLAVGTLPPGLSLSSAGALSGTPTASGTASFTAQVRDANGVTASRALTLAVFARPSVATSSLPDGYTGLAYGAALSASGGKAPYAWTLSAGALPQGLSLSSAGALSGTPTSSGTASFTARVTDANGVTASRALTLTVSSPPAVTTASLPNGYAGTAYSASLSASGGKAPYSWTLAAGALPSGLALSSAGALSGTPIAMGTASFTAQVTDANGVTASRALTLAVPAQGGGLLAGGSDHSVIVRQDGTVWAWGDNIYGQLGDGTFNSRLKPARVPGLSGVTALAAGNRYTVALRQDGTVWAWGGNYSGQLGIGTTPSSSSPVQVPGLSGVTAIAARHLHTVALRQDGTVWAWGLNNFGQLGDGTTSNSATPVRVPGLSGVTAIAAGAFHTVALRQDGTVWAWGLNTGGQLGDGTTVNRAFPTQVPGLSGVIAISAGTHHTVARRQDGTVWDWGYGKPSEEEDGTTVGLSYPAQVPGLGGVIDISAGSDHTVARRQDGTVWTWGLNNFGQLGNGTNTNSAAPVQVPGLSGVTALAAGAAYSVARRQDGTVWAWGGNTSGQLGDGTTVNRSLPVQVLLGLSGITALAGGGHHTVALRDVGTVWAWGLAGQLGNGNTEVHGPVQVPNLSGITALAAGELHTVARRQDGTLWTWGYNEWGQLGDGTTTFRYSVMQVPDISGVTAVAAGYGNTFARRQDGTVWAWGRNDFGQLGDGTTTRRLTPVQVMGLSGVTALAAGGYHMVALRQDGTVWTWGSNYFGELGDGTFTPRPAPAQVPGLSGVTAIAAGQYHTVALRQDGTVWAWGYNAWGQLGDGTTTQRPEPAQVPGLSGVTAIAAGVGQTLARQDNTLWAWGWNYSGQLGDGTTTNRLAPVQVLPAF